MSFGLSRGRSLDVAPGKVAVGAEELGPLPDDILSNPEGAWVDSRQWFPESSRPLELEIGSGKGTFLLQQAAAMPDVNFLGIEIAREFFEYTADRVRRSGLTNIRVLNTDAAEFLRWRCPPNIFRVVHIYFPDPWPKRRHHRRRIVQDEFLTHCVRVLEPGGEVRLVTDHDDYWAWIEAHLARWCDAASNVESTRPFIREDFERSVTAGDGELVGTNFERKYRREGRPFHAVVVRRK